MPGEDAAFENQISTGLNQHLRGWDFSWLNERTHEEKLPWTYRAVVLAHMSGAGALLDVGTGGGEVFSSLFQPPYSMPVPPVAWATEGYPPNVIEARARLAPLGIQVADVSGLPAGTTPFAGQTFDLIIDRHMGIPGRELFRILQPGGRFITQQVGGANCAEFNRLLGGPPQEYSHYTLEYAVRDLEEAGLRVVHQQEAFPRWTFYDLAGVVFYLKTISWQIPGFTVEEYRPALYELFKAIQRDGGVTVHQHRMLLQAARPQGT